jgi:hypothetical protein
MTEQNAKILLLGPGPLDQKMKAFASTAQALASIPTWQREIGQRVTVVESGVAKLYWFETGIADGDLVLFPVGAGGGDFIPLAGTEPGKPVTGMIEFQGEFGTPPNQKNGFVSNRVVDDVDNTFEIILSDPETTFPYLKFKDNVNGGYCELVFDYSSINITGNGPNGVFSIQDRNETPRGITSNLDYSDNIQSLDYVQKKYVDDKVISAHGTLTITDDETTWNTTTGLNKKLACGGDFTLIITNLANGMSGALTIDCLDATVITLDTDTVPAKGNGSLELEEGYYVFAFVYDGSLLFWNIANYA